MSEQGVLLIIFNIFTAIFFYLERKRSVMNPTVYYLFFNWVMVVGCFQYFEFDLKADITHSLILMFTPIFIFIGYKLAIGRQNIQAIYNSFWNETPLIPINKNQSKKILILFVITIFLSLLYYQLVGYNLVFLSLTSNVEDFVSLRLGAYSGENYYAPGFFNQFKNTIFPILYVYYAYKLKGTKWFWSYVIILGLILLYALTGTGQRTFIITGFLIVISILYGLNNGKLQRKYIFLSFGLVIVIFTFLSLRLNRTSDSSILGSFQQLFYRVFDSNQYSAIVGFRYIYEQDIQLGAEWLQSLVGLIPGVKGSDLSNRIFNVLFGGFRGTAPLNVWGSAYHNFGILGSVYLGIAIGYFYTKIYLRFLKGSKNIVRICVYCALFIYLATWIAGAPPQLINNGLLGCFVILLLLKLKA
ncbi:O-antigen polymerase [Dokdonia sp.]|uniref:O-antigen polymerase n=1 Tax=Dokdonia sp. TaxID=2024995 RepID=UPI0032660680